MDKEYEEKLKKIVNKSFKFNYEHRNSGVSIERCYNDKQDILKVTSFGINWCAMGTVDIKKCSDFINVLQEGIEEVSMLNSLLNVLNNLEDKNERNNN